MIEQDERLIVLGSLFHDIGKVEQICTGNPNNISTLQSGYNLLDSSRFRKLFEKILGSNNFVTLLTIFTDNKENNFSEIYEIIQIANQLSSGKKFVDELDFNKKNNRYLGSSFARVNLLSDIENTTKYYRHKTLYKSDFNIFIPETLNETEIQEKQYCYNESHFRSFIQELEFVLKLYQDENDFTSLVNHIHLLFEKWMWCIPESCGVTESDISLYNHIKDVTAIAHTIYLTRKENPDSNKLCLVIGDIPGIQKYIFDVVNKKPAKILRGRSIFVQVLIRNFATLFLSECNLTESNLLMLAGGKFYLLAPDTDRFIDSFNSVTKKIESYLFENFRMELSFNAICYKFNYEELIDKKKTFGQIIEEASIKLLQNRYSLFSSRLFNNDQISKENYIWQENYINTDGAGTDSIKCAVTNIPIRKDGGKTRERKILDGDEVYKVDLQVKNEYEIGSRVIGDNLIIQLDDNHLDIIPNKTKKLEKCKNDEFNQNYKLIINPDLDKLYSSDSLNKLGRDFYINFSTLQVANYCSVTESHKSVLPFEEIVKEQEGAKYLTLIKGDIDNLGLIMAYGLDNDKNGITTISQITTLSLHLKFYFSFFLNGFLEDWEKKGNLSSMDKRTNKNSNAPHKVLNPNKVYTIFAGGDDLMLITTQQSAIKLVNEFNKKFQEFVSNNKEVHISYSLTNFKDHSPIRIIADIAEENQKSGKNQTKPKQLSLLEEENPYSFHLVNDKSLASLFNGFVHNSDLDLFIHYVDKLSKWVTENEISHGLIQKIFELSNMRQKYNETKDAAYLISYARTNHVVSRIDNLGDDINQFLQKILLINSENDVEAEKIKSFLKPLLCQVIYNTRNL